MHVGLSGLVQTVGLGAFAWMALTGSLMFFCLTPGYKARGFLHLVKEMHEAVMWLIPIYLGIHVGAVLLHALAGDHRWQRTFFLKK
jgi:cytochrome b561